MQQIAISGVGGQGILFITKLLAETALEMGCSILISETHGMAQRGGNVISHLKVSSREPSGEGQGDKSGPSLHTGRFFSPLIRPGRADILMVLHPDGLKAHGFYLRPEGNIFCNTSDDAGNWSLDATRIAADLGSPISANLVLLGFAAGSASLFCKPGEVREILKRHGGKRLEAALRAFDAGVDEAVGRQSGPAPADR
jgi:indolepyruvate ferredoxin oxidoreductase beta subunit